VTRYTIAFFREAEKSREADILLLSGGYIVFWSCRNDSIIEVKEDWRENWK